MKLKFRILSVLLAAILLLQTGALATDGAQPQTETEPAAQTETVEPAQTIEPAEADAPAVQAEEGEEGEDEPEPPAEPVTLEASLADGAQVHKRSQRLQVRARQGETALDAAGITLSLNGAPVTGTVEDGAAVFALQLVLGENTLVLRAGEGETAAELTLHVSFTLEGVTGWAANALTFCVNNGILQGDTTGSLQPTDPATRAQLAAMLVRLFGATETASLAGYSDVPASAWYYNEMARAVAMSIYEGSNGRLNPNDPITREQAFTVIARAFGVAGGTRESVARFSDSGAVSAWALSTVGAMVDAGYVKGSTDGKLNPKSSITRQELAQVLYNILDTITADASQVTGGATLLTGDPAALNGKSVDGDLYLSYGCGTEITLTGLQLTGRLVVRLQSGSKLHLVGCSYESLSICAPVAVDADAPAPRALLMADGAQLTGGAQQTLLTAGGTLSGGSYSSVTVEDGSLTLTATAQADTISVLSTASYETLYLNGNVGTLDANAKMLTVKGDGTIGTFYRYYADTAMLCRVTNEYDRIDAGLRGITITEGKQPTAYTNARTITVTGTISNVNTTQVYGVPGGVRTVTVTYSHNGKVIKTDNNFKLTNGAQLSCTFSVPFYAGMSSWQTVDVRISYKDQTVPVKLGFNAYNHSTYYNEAKKVQTIHVEATVLSSCSGYAYSSLSGWRTSFARGTVLYFLKYENNAALVETKSGSRYWVPSGSISVSSKTYYSTSVAYSTGVKESFVNDVHDYSSPSKYLVWINLYTETVNVFQGSQGNWKLLRSCRCSSGKNISPTRPGVHYIYSRTYMWTFDDDYYRVFYPSLFDGGIALHTRTYYTGTSTLLDSRLGMTITHGCVRIPDNDAIWIYNNCPIGTTVVVW